MSNLRSPRKVQPCVCTAYIVVFYVIMFVVCYCFSRCFHCLNIMGLFCVILRAKVHSAIKKLCLLSPMLFSDILKMCLTSKAPRDDSQSSLF